MGNGAGAAEGAVIEIFDDPETGGVRYTVDAAGDDADFVHCEIVGYALSDAVRAGDGCRARRLAEFLVRHQNPDGTFPHSVRSSSAAGCRSGESHAFDAAICARALLEEGSRTSHSAALAALERIASAVDAQGRVPARLDALPHDRSGLWSDDGGCYLAKLVPILARGGFLEASQAIKERMLRVQRPDGAWNASPRCPHVHSHAMCYALEGLAIDCERSGNRETDESVCAGIGWLARCAVADEGLAEWPEGGTRGRSWRSDSQVQMLRLLKWPSLSMDVLHVAAAEACRRRLRTLETELGWRFDDRSARIPSWTVIFQRSLMRMGRMPWAEAMT